MGAAPGACALPFPPLSSFHSPRSPLRLRRSVGFLRCSGRCRSFEAQLPLPRPSPSPRPAGESEVVSAPGSWAPRCGGEEGSDRVGSRERVGGLRRRAGVWGRWRIPQEGRRGRSWGKDGLREPWDRRQERAGSGGGGESEPRALPQLTRGGQGPGLGERRARRSH